MAKRKKNITKAALLRFQERLQNAPTKAKDTFSPTEVVEASREQIRDALANGHSYEDIAAFLAEEIIADGNKDSISASTLASYFRAAEAKVNPVKKKTSAKTKRKPNAPFKDETLTPAKTNGTEATDHVSGDERVDDKTSALVSRTPIMAPEDKDDAWADVGSSQTAAATPNMPAADLEVTDADTPQADQGTKNAHVSGGNDTSGTPRSDTQVDPQSTKAASKQQMQDAFNRMESSGRQGR